MYERIIRGFFLFILLLNMFLLWKNLCFSCRFSEQALSHFMDQSISSDSAHSCFYPETCMWCGYDQWKSFLHISSSFQTRFVISFVSSFQTRDASLGGSVGCAVRLETRRSRVQAPLRSATFFRGEWSWNIFYSHSLPSAGSRRAVVSFWRKNVHNTG